MALHQTVQVQLRHGCFVTKRQVKQLLSIEEMVTWRYNLFVSVLAFTYGRDTRYSRHLGGASAKRPECPGDRCDISGLDL
jgi:hypothetical protein